MHYRRLNFIVGAGIFIISFFTYWLTVQPSVPFWDCGELSATVYTMAVPHPPGAPLFHIIGRVFQMVPFVQDTGLRLNAFSVLASAFTVLLLYLISVRVIRQWRGDPKSVTDYIITFGSAAVGALTYNFSDTFWFNAVESEVFALSMFFLSFVVYVGLVWYERADEPRSDRYLLLASYLVGLSIGVHQLSLLCFFTVATFVYVRRYKVTAKSFLIFLGVAAAAFAVIYFGIVRWLPGLLNGRLGSPAETPGEGSTLVRMIPAFVTAGFIYLVYWGTKKKNVLVASVAMAALLIILGYTTYTAVVIRAGVHTPINENNPDNLERLSEYINRAQYGETPSLFDRMWDKQPEKQANYRKYSGPGDYFWNYQINHMYLRYLGFNFVGRDGDSQDAPVALFKGATAWSESDAFPNRYFALPLLLGFLGLWYHFRKSWKFAFAFFALFFMTGLWLTIYFNMAEPQPRERDYFFVGSFFVFALWVGLGTSAILEFVEQKLLGHAKQLFFLGLTLAAVAFIVPVNMGTQNWHDHDRSGNYTPWDYSYNMLQSCPKDAILFTNGDNDTFPLWYIQEVAGVRTDIRIVNLSLIQTPWYAKQMKNERPHGTAPVPMSLSDEQIDNITTQGGVLWKTHDVTMPISSEVIGGYGVTDTAVINRKAITFTVRGTQIGAETGQPVEILTSQAAMVLNIVQNTGWSRPVCFAVTTLDDSHVGLDEYFQMEGLVYRLTPKKRTSAWDNIDPGILARQVLDEPKASFTDYHPGFKFRGLNDSTLYLDENQTRLAINYRNSFVRLAVYYANKENSKEKVREVLNTMERKIPDRLLPMPYWAIGDVASLYNFAGERTKAEELLGAIERRAFRALALNPREGLSQFNPYVVLMNLYEERQQYQKEIEIIRQIRAIYPEQQEVPEWADQRIAQLEAVVKATSKPDTTRR